MNKKEVNTHLGVKIKKNTKNLLQDVCTKRGEVVSSFVRRAIKKELASLGFYEDEIKKALGMKI